MTPFESEKGGTSEHVGAEHVAFHLDSEHWALPIVGLREIVRVIPLTEVPRAAPALLGVMNLRGKVLPVYSLKRRLGFSTEPARIAGPEADLASVPRGARIIVVRSSEGDAGLLVDEVREVVRLRASSLEPPEAKAGEAHEAIAGVAREGDQRFFLLDLEQVFR